MGLHTWFIKNKKLYDEQNILFEKLDKHDIGEIYLDDMEIYQINNRINEIDKLNKTNYHDCFRTSKRENNGEYTLDVIYSKKECDKWLIDNVKSVYYIDHEYLNKFWIEYPDGIIYFG